MGFGMPSIELNAEERIVAGTNGNRDWEEHLYRWEWATNKLTEKATILVAGCGYGYEFLFYRRKNPKLIYAFDKPEIIELTHRFFPEVATSGDDLETCEAIQAIPNEVLDFAISFETIEHLANPNNFIETIKAKLKEGGKFLGSIPLNSHAGGHKVFYYSGDEVKEIFLKHFKYVKIEMQNDLFGRQDYGFVLFEATK